MNVVLPLAHIKHNYKDTDIALIRKTIVKIDVQLNLKIITWQNQEWQTPGRKFKWDSNKPPS